MDLTKHERESLSNYLATRLAETGAFQVMPGEEIRKRLGEKKKESYKECYDRSCQIDLGREMAAEKSLSTQLSRMGSKCTLTMTMYDLKKAAAEAAATERGGCDTDGIMALLGRAVDRLAGASGKWGGKVTVTEFDLASSADTGRDIENPIVDETGFLFVDSKPRGAAVIINGQEKGVTPFQAELMAGRYVVLCAKGALYLPARKEVELTTRGLRLNMDLKPNFGVLEVTSDPPGASIELDGEPTGQTTPHTFKPKKAGRYKVKLTLDLYLSMTLEATLGNGRKTPLSVKRGQEASLSLELKGRYGMLVVTAAVVDEGSETPAQAEVWVDGKKMDAPTPFKDRLLVGSYDVEVRAEQAREFRARVQVEEGEKTRVEARLEKLLPEEVRRQREVERQALMKKQEEEQARLVQARSELFPYKNWGHGLFWPGAGLAVFGGVSAIVGYQAGQEYQYSSSRTWAGLMYAGLGAGTALLVGGAILWALEPDEDEIIGSTTLSPAPVEGGMGLSLVGRW